MKIRSMFKALIGVAVAMVFAITIFRFSTADYSGKPTREILVTEITQIRTLVGGTQAPYFNKGSIQGASVTSPLKSNPEILALRFAASAESAGWKEIPLQIDGAGVHKKYCKGRMSLVFDSVSDTPPYFEYGVYWTIDKNSSLYCNGSMQSVR